MRLRLVLPYPPSVNHYLGRTRNGRVYVKTEGKNYRHRVFWKTRGHDTIEGKVAVYACAFPPDKRRRDLDDLWKCLLDAIVNAGLIVDDGDIDDLHIVRGPICSEGRVIVEIRKIEAA